MGDELVKVGIVAEDKTGPGVASAKRNLDSLGKGAQSAAQSFGTLKAAAVGVGGALAVLGGSAVISGLTGMAKGALQSYAEFERLGQSINALTAKQALLSGSASTMEQALKQTSAQSKELLGWIQKLAIESPFRQDDVAQAFRLAMALGFNTKEAQRLTSAMLNFATATGQGGDTIERINRALGQMKTKGKVSLEEINQLTESGVDAMRILQDATGKTGEALYKDISKGLVSADFAINAIIADTEKLYAGAGAASANSMAGLLSTLGEMQEMIGRDLFTGVFEQLQGPLGALTTILTAPEFKAGLAQWSATLGNFTGEQIEAAAKAMERIDAAISPLLNAQAPAWLVALQGAALMSGTEFKIKITPEVTSITAPDGGWKIEVKPYATTITGANGEMLSVDVQAKSLTMSPGANIPPITIKANISEEDKKIIDALTGAASTGGAKGFGQELGLQMRKDLQGEMSSAAEWLNLNFGITFGGKATLQELVDEKSAGATATLDAKWGETSNGKLWVDTQTYFNQTWTKINLVGEWAKGVLDALWSSVQAAFTAKPINVLTHVSVAPSAGYDSPYGSQMRTLTRQRSGEGYGMTRPGMYSGWGDAVGDGFFRGGLALVGEAGPELAVLPRGTAIYSNRDTRSLYGGSIPRFATGTTQLPPGSGPLIGLLKAVGLWVPQGGGAQMGPKTEAESKGWQDFTKRGGEAMEKAAKKTSDAFEEAAKKTNQAFESALSSVPGLFGTSSVTADQMRLGALGVPQNFADDYVRRLSDEVLNGVDWEGVDIGDAAKRAGIDPNLPAEVILELFKNAWNDSSLFANSANLDLINQDAVKAAIEQQQKEMQGQMNIKALFGITDENMQKQSEALGVGLAAVFGGAAESDAVKGAGATVFEAMGKGLADGGAASKNIASMADSLKTAIGTPENQAAMYDNGYAAYAPWSRGFAAAAAAAAIPAPGGGTGGTGATIPPGKAVGTGFWQGGWMTVHANETIYAPRGTTVRNARESSRGGGGVTVVNNVTINRQIDEAAFMARMARQLRRAS